MGSFVLGGVPERQSGARKVGFVQMVVCLKDKMNCKKGEIVYDGVSQRQNELKVGEIVYDGVSQGQNEVKKGEIVYDGVS
ncbi:hypothetical protein [Mesobacillus maritimus]|uniref:Uncharacterized protein n=1 Tax=Mesobacillus maritimus TaxID=1643336 RepID=A0ABS7K9Q9_9BACI|nr:hypothetical protein [Mesobacillus maritimus]MBY0099006.1 hypothetical protein [Mesobacillus maritimus]